MPITEIMQTFVFSRTNLYFQEFGIGLGNPKFSFMTEILVTDQSFYLSTFLILIFKRKKLK